MVFDDVRALDLNGFRTTLATGSAPVVWMNNVRDVLVRGSRPAPAETFLRLSGVRTAGIILTGNDFNHIGRAVGSDLDVPSSALKEAAIRVKSGATSVH